MTLNIPQRYQHLPYLHYYISRYHITLQFMKRELILVRVHDYGKVGLSQHWMGCHLHSTLG